MQLYESEEFLASAVATFLAAGIRAGQPILVIATPEHRTAFLEHLRSLKVDVDDLTSAGEVLWLDARETLSRFMVGTMPSRERFELVLAEAIQRLMKLRPYVVVRAYGEMVDLLWRDGNSAAAVALERMWNDASEHYAFDLLCAYPMSDFASDAHTADFERVCHAHKVVLPTESYVGLAEDERLRHIALLQQRTAALEAEVQRRSHLESVLRDSLQKRRLVEEQLHRRELELRDFLENGLEPMHWVGPTGTILWANRAELEMLGYAREEFVGRNVMEFHADRDVIESILARLERGEDLKNVRARLRCKDGSIKPVLINSNVYWQDGKFVHTRCFTRDISDLKLAD